MVDFVHLDELISKKHTGELFLLSNDIAELNKYFNVINDFKEGLSGQLNWMRQIKDKATRLLVLLREKGYK
jgi:hypothetical protein